MSYDIAFAGIGGQGILFIGTLLASAAIKEGKEVAYTPSFKGQMRGGRSTCMVNISSEPIFSPVVDRYDAAITLAQQSLNTFEPLVKPGGTLIWENSMIKVPPQREDLRIYALPAYNTAIEVLKDTKMMNMIMLGAFIKIQGIVKIESIIGALHETLSPGQEELIPLNEKAFELGQSLASGSPPF